MLTSFLHTFKPTHARSLYTYTRTHMQYNVLHVDSCALCPTCLIRIKTRLECKHASNTNTPRMQTRLECKHASNANTPRMQTRLKYKHASNTNTPRIQTRLGYNMDSNAPRIHVHVDVTRADIHTCDEA